MAPQSFKTRLFAPLLAAGLLLTPTLVCADDGPSPAELYGKAMVAVETEKRPDALRLLKQFRESFPKHALAPRAVATEARLLVELDRVKEAEELIAKARETWPEDDDLRNRLDALTIHLKTGRGQGKRAAQRMNAMKKQLNEARKAGDKAKAEQLEKQLDRFEKAAKARRAGPKVEGDVEQLRESQEELIARAHELEDEGKTAEAYEMRRKADEIAAKIEALSRNRGRNRGKGKGNKNRPENRRLAALKGELRKIEKRMKAAKEAGEQDKLRELMELRANLLKERQELSRGRGDKGQGKGKGRQFAREYAETARALAKARKAAGDDAKDGDEPVMGGDEMMEGDDKSDDPAKGPQVKALEAKLAKLTARHLEQAEKQSRRQAERLEKTLRRQGVEGGELEQRVKWARREHSEAARLQLEMLAMDAELEARGVEPKQRREQQKARREAFRKESMERRREFMRGLRERENALRKAREQAALEQHLSEVKAQLAQQGVEGPEAEAQLKKAQQEFRNRLNEQRKLEAEKRRALMAERRERELGKRLERFQARLKQRGLSDEEIAKRVERERAKAMNSDAAKKPGKPSKAERKKARLLAKARKDSGKDAEKDAEKNANKNDDGEAMDSSAESDKSETAEKRKKDKGKGGQAKLKRRIQKLENELDQLRKMVKKLMKERGAEGSSTTPAETTPQPKTGDSPAEKSETKPATKPSENEPRQPLR